jgi:hypothetical protein
VARYRPVTVLSGCNPPLTRTAGGGCKQPSMPEPLIAQTWLHHADGSATSVKQTCIARRAQVSSQNGDG